MFSFIIAIHVIACSLLIILVLIQQGKGGGLIGSLSSAESIFGTKTNDFLVKSTSVFAIVFFVTCLCLAFLSIQRNKSILTTGYKAPAKTAASTQAQEPAKPQETAQQPGAAATPAAVAEKAAITPQAQQQDKQALSPDTKTQTPEPAAQSPQTTEK